MTLLSKKLWRFPVRLSSGLSLAGILACSGPAAEIAPPPVIVTASSVTSAPAVAPAHTLADCIAIALEHQPTVKAAQASLAAAETQSGGLDSLRGVANIVQHDLEIRKQQACLGVTIAQAGLRKAEQETIYAVTRTYLTVQYAQSQRKVAAEVVDNLKFYQERVSDVVKKGESRDLTTNSVDKITVYLGLARNRLSEAEQGIERARAALREALGVCADYPLTLPEGLPQPVVTLTKDEVVQLALSHRAELVQANTGVEVFLLEVEAQCKSSPLPGQVPTFAAGGDIHSQQVPQGISNGEYRPGAIPPEMPVFLAGPRATRIQRAQALTARAQAVAEKAHNLIVLEAEDGYYRFLEAQAKLSQGKEAAEAGTRLAKNTRADFRGEQKVKLDEVLTNEVLGGQAQGALNEGQYQVDLALAALERITGGAFCSGLTRPAPSDK